MVTVERLRAAGERTVAFVTTDGTIRGRIVQTKLGDDAVMVLVAVAGGESVVVPLAAIRDVVEER